MNKSLSYCKWLSPLTPSPLFAPMDYQHPPPLCYHGSDVHPHVIPSLYRFSSTIRVRWPVCVLPLYFSLPPSPAAYVHVPIYDGDITKFTTVVVFCCRLVNYHNIRLFCLFIFYSYQLIVRQSRTPFLVVFISCCSSRLDRFSVGHHCSIESFYFASSRRYL